MATHTTLTSLFTDIADAIREKTGDTENIVADEFPDAIADIPSGGEDIAEEMKIMDEYYRITNSYLRSYSENDYTQSEVNKVDDLLNKLGGNNNG